MAIKGRRFVGVWDEAPLAQQIARVLAGNDEPVIRDRVLAAQFVTEDDARRMAEQQRAARAEARGMAPVPGDTSMPPGLEDLPTPSLTDEDDHPPSSGLYVPGR